MPLDENTIFSDKVVFAGRITRFLLIVADTFDH